MGLFTTARTHRYAFEFIVKPTIMTDTVEKTKTKARLVQKNIRMGHRDIIKYQMITHCFMRDIQLSNNELDALTLLGVYGEHDLADFCGAAVEESIFKTKQTVRNFLTKACKLKLVHKEGTTQKKVCLVDALSIQTRGTIVLQYTIVYVAQEQ